MQCCPMDTYSGREDVYGNPVADCSCLEECGCLCIDCICGREDNDDG